MSEPEKDVLLMFDTLFVNKRIRPTVGGQMLGQELWTFSATGHQIVEVREAIAELSGRTVTVPVDVLRELADLRAEYARVRRVAQQIADGSGCANCRGIAIEFDTTVGKE